VASGNGVPDQPSYRGYDQKTDFSIQVRGSYSIKKKQSGPDDEDGEKEVEEGSVGDDDSGGEACHRRQTELIKVLGALDRNGFKNLVIHFA
jgi:hypothetical protein